MSPAPRAHRSPANPDTMIQRTQALARSAGLSRLAAISAFSAISALAATFATTLASPAMAQPAPTSSAPLQAAASGVPPVRIDAVFDDVGLSAARASELATQVLAADKAEAMRSAGLALQTIVFSFKSGNCYVQLGPSMPGTPGRVPRASEYTAWQLAERRGQEPAQAVCERAFTTALKDLASVADGAFSAQGLQEAVELTSDPVKPKFDASPRKAKTIQYSTYGLSDKGRQWLIDTLGDRWNTVLDHRKFVAYAYLRQASTVEGNKYCLMLYGLTSASPAQVNKLLPANLRVRYTIQRDGSRCDDEVIETALNDLRDTYDADLDLLYGIGQERGQTYPAVAELKKAVIKYDDAQKKLAAKQAAQQAAQQAKLAAQQAKQPARQTQATTTTRNVLRCTNNCVNGNCLRTFEDGRQERWQAPRRLNPFTSNWEWDTTTNACGA